MAKNRVEKGPQNPCFGRPKSGGAPGVNGPKKTKNPLYKIPIFICRVLGLAKSLFLQGQIKYFCPFLITFALGRIGRYHITL